MKLIKVRIDQNKNRVEMLCKYVCEKKNIFRTYKCLSSYLMGKYINKC